MLKQRVITALVLLPLLLALVFLAPTAMVYGVLSLAGLVIAWEWAGLMAWPAPTQRAAYAALVGLALVVGWFSPLRGDWLWLLLALSCLWWLAAPLLFAGFPDNLRRRPLSRAFLGGLGVVLIAATLLGLARLHALDNGPLKLLFVLFLVFAADTGAYFAGRRFGRRKLAPTISPNKSVEGALGGLLLSAVWALAVGSWVFDFSAVATVGLLALSMLAAAASIVGDLAESMLKRVAGIKDSGHILPGHGGLLDRVDSVLAAVPVMVLGLELPAL